MGVPKERFVPHWGIAATYLNDGVCGDDMRIISRRSKEVKRKKKQPDKSESTVEDKSELSALDRPEDRNALGKDPKRRGK